MEDQDLQTIEDYCQRLQDLLNTQDEVLEALERVLDNQRTRWRSKEVPEGEILWIKDQDDKEVRRAVFLFDLAEEVFLSFRDFPSLQRKLQEAPASVESTSRTIETSFAP